MHIYTITSEEREPELEVWTAEEPDMYSDDDMPPNTEPLQDNELSVVKAGSYYLKAAKSKF